MNVKDFLTKTEISNEGLYDLRVAVAIKKFKSLSEHDSHDEDYADYISRSYLIHRSNETIIAIARESMSVTSYIPIGGNHGQIDTDGTCGFITDQYRFVGRSEGAIIATAAGQLKSSMRLNDWKVLYHLGLDSYYLWEK